MPYPTEPQGLEPYDHVMEKVLEGGSYPLTDPHTEEVVRWESAVDVFNEIIHGAWQNGEPGMVFLDRINADNKMLGEYGPMIATNPCGEQPLLGNESCNLGSINLAKFFRDTDVQLGEDLWKKQIDWERLEFVTRTAVHFLDNIIDANEYATPEIEEMTKATRKIGLGVMGFADLLIQLRISYNSELAREAGEFIIDSIKKWSEDESLKLGAMRGTFPAWERSSYNKVTEAYRNNCRLTVAPTGTISMIADCSSGIEPIFALAWKKQNILEGKSFNYVNKYFERDAKKHGFYSESLMNYLVEGGSLQDIDTVPTWAKNLYMTAPEISPSDHVLMQSAFQKHVDSGISKTINFDNSATYDDVDEVYKLAWKTGCKGITVYRAGSRDKEVLVKGAVESSSVEDLQLEFAFDVNLTPIKTKSLDQCCETPYIIKESGCETCKTCGWSACLIA